MSDYKRNPRGARRARKSMGRKAIVVLSLMMVLVLAAVGGTLAWLTDQSDTVTNTFTTSDIDISLTETGATGSNGALANSYKMVPGYTIAKDPKVTVKTGSEPCYLFVKLEKSTNFDKFLTYEIATGWTQLKDADNKEVAGVYYREVATADMGTAYSVLSGDQVTVKTTVTKTDMNGLTTETYPTLKVTAYATQYMKDNENSFTAIDAWGNIGN